MSAHMIQLPRAPKAGSKKTAKSPLLHRLIEDLSPSKVAVKSLYIELKRHSSHKRHEMHAKSVILQNYEINRESTTFKLSSSIDIGTSSKVIALNKSRTNASKIGFNREILADKSNKIALHRDGTSKTLNMDLNNDYDPNSSVASITSTTSKMFMATPYHNFNLITSGQIDYNTFGLIEYSIYGYYDQGYSINLVAGMSEEPWALFIPSSTYSSELNILWGRMRSKKEAFHKAKLAQWMLNCTTLEFDNSTHTIKSTSFDHKLFVNYHIHEITIILDSCARVLTKAIRKYSNAKRKYKLLVMKQVADAGRNAAAQRIKAHNGYKGNKGNNFTARYNSIMRNSTQNIKQLYKSVDGTIKAKKDRTIYNEYKVYDPVSSEFSNSLADYALDWLEDYESMGDAYHINGESNELLQPETNEYSTTTGDMHHSTMYSDSYDNCSSIYNTKPVFTSESDPFGLFTPPVVSKKQHNMSSATTLTRSENTIDILEPGDSSEYEVEEIEEVVEEEEESVVDVVNQDNIDSYQHEDQNPTEEVSHATPVVAATQDKGGFFSSISSFFFGKRSENSANKSSAVTEHSSTAKEVVSTSSAVIELGSTAKEAVNDTEVVNDTSLVALDPTGSSEYESIEHVTSTSNHVEVQDDESGGDYDTQLDKKAEDWAASLFKSTV